MTQPDLHIRDATIDDLPLIREALYGALSWNPDVTLPAIEHTLVHPEVRRYHDGWGRAGDEAVVAEAHGEPVGAAFYRLFTDEDHGHGYIDAETPELGIAVRAGHRGEGVGARLLEALAERARRDGIARLSLSVSHGNPAARLYARHGYEEVSRDDEGVRMVKEL